MPGGDGTGPRGTGRGRGLGGRHSGPEGECRCPNCGKTITHQRGTPCNMIKCPDCGTQMTRGSL